MEEGSLWKRKKLLLPATAMGLASCLALVIAHCHHPLLQNHLKHIGLSFEESKEMSPPPITSCPQWCSTSPWQSGPFPHPPEVASSCTHSFWLLYYLLLCMEWFEVFKKLSYSVTIIVVTYLLFGSCLVSRCWGSFMKQRAITHYGSPNILCEYYCDFCDDFS